MNVSIEVDTANLENKLYLLAKEARVAPGVVIKEEARFVTESIIKFTPPKTSAQGRAAIKRDMNNVATSLPRDDAIGEHWKPLNRLARAGDAAGVQRILNRWKGSPRFTMDKSLIEPEHLRKRTKYGRVHAKPSLFAFARTVNGYLKNVQSRVGWAKGAWVAALIATGGRAPNWYGRHSGNAGYALANFGENPSVSATARNIKIPGYQKTVTAAVRSRERTTQKKIDALIAGRAVNLGFMTVAAR